MIWWLAPNLGTQSGGLLMIRTYARLLNLSGRPSRVWFGPPAPGYATADDLVARELALQPGDVLVVPETGGTKWSFLVGRTPVVMLVQGPDFTFSDSGFLDDHHEPYPGWPSVAAVIATSDTLGRFVSRVTRGELPVHSVPVIVDPDLFQPGRKERLIALMPRRRPEDLLAVVHLVRRSGRLPEGWDVTLIDAMTPAAVATVLGRSAIFLSGAEREGFGLPGAEAMASGCHVIGFTGHGASEYMTPDCSVAVAESDVVAMADAVIDSAVRFDTDRAGWQEVVERGRERVLARYRPDVVVERLAVTFDELMTEGSASLVREPATIRHFQAYAPSTALVPRTYVAARSVLGRVKRRLQRRP